ncbi:hypothetical protein TNCT_72581 [Trichonephila clavata]|uniref:Uncharacterized protein n=1 Tax=Trichonephila clavata TaxID=2740835 RepID=A0A8X6H480_TRICU|nr:hypothetical protein TNCT_72581 [Trichonephila clavata]
MTFFSVIQFPSHFQIKNSSDGSGFDLGPSSKEGRRRVSLAPNRDRREKLSPSATIDSNRHRHECRDAFDATFSWG